MNLYAGPTTGIAPGYVQANTVTLAAEYAGEFMQYCLNNPKHCPLLGVSRPGSKRIEHLGQNLDLSTDIPKYLLWSDGEVMGDCTEIASIWRDDWVTFALGCSFSFEHALQQKGIELAHIRDSKNVAMFDTDLATLPAGRFGGNSVVSMRPIPRARVSEVFAVCSAFEFSHGAPIHVGSPDEIGIQDLQVPDYGDAVSIAEDEVPVFWACGVTTQIALKNANLPEYITHAPGYMLVTDLQKVTEGLSAKVSAEFYSIFSSIW